MALIDPRSGNTVSKALKQAGYTAAFNTIAPLLKDAYATYQAMPPRRDLRPQPQVKRVARRKKKSGGGGTTIPRQLGYGAGTSLNRQIQMARTTCGGIYTVDNTAGQTHFSNVSLNLSVGAGNLGSSMPRLFTLAGLFRRWRLIRFEATWVSTLSMNSGGTIASCFDADPTGAVLSSLAAAVQARIFAMGSVVKDTPSIVWTRAAAGNPEDKYTVASGKDPEEGSYGLFQVASKNTELNAVNLGYYVFEATVDFYEMH